MSYIVTGHNRTGTNMMFRMLAAGGLPTNMTKRCCEFGSKMYDPNPHGLFEYSGEKILAGNVLKHNRLFDIEQGLPSGVKVVVMRRSIKEIILSHGRSWGALHGITEKKIENHYNSLVTYLNDNEVLYVDVEYAAVIDDAHRELSRVKDFGVPICVNDAASVVDADLYRCKVA